jgi:acetyl esterase/lipase
MPSPESQRIRAAFGDKYADLDVPLETARADWERATRDVPLPPGVEVPAVTRADWVQPSTAPENQVLVWLHGGGFTTGSSITHRPWAAQLALATRARILVPDYRLAPEFPFPAAVDDTIATLDWLLGQNIPIDRIAIGGDSAGAAIAMSALVRLRDGYRALPAAAVLVSPWLDLALRGETLETRDHLDPMVSAAALRAAAHHYLGNTSPTDPLASPVYADLTGLPPLLILAGDHEVLLDDARRLAATARGAGVEVHLDVQEHMWHCWPAWAPELPEAVDALESIADFLRHR